MCVGLCSACVVDAAPRSFFTAIPWSIKKFIPTSVTRAAKKYMIQKLNGIHKSVSASFFDGLPA
jgi:hypothetical protein